MEQHDRIAVKSAFVLNCAQQHTLLDPDDYSFEGTRLKRKRGRQSTKNAPLVRLKKNKLQIDRSEKTSKSTPKSPKVTMTTEDRDLQKDSKVPKTPTRHVKVEETPPDLAASIYDACVPRERSPTPPSKAIEYSAGRMLYLEEDRNYVHRYVPILLAREPSMTLSAIAVKLHDKVT